MNNSINTFVNYFENKLLIHGKEETKKQTNLNERIFNLTHSNFKQMNEITSRTVSAYLQKNVSTLESAITYLELNQIYPDRYTYSQLLKKEGDWSSIQQLYYSIPSNLVDTVMKNIFFLHAGKNNDYQLAKEIYLEILDSQSADEFTFSNMIEVAAMYHDSHELDKAYIYGINYFPYSKFIYNNYIKVKEIDKATTVYKEMRKLKLDDTYTYCHMAQKASQEGYLDLATVILQQAKERGLTSDSLYNIYIDLLIEKGDINQAKTIFKESNLKYNFEFQNYYFKLDLHGYSHGTGITILHLLADQYEEGVPSFECVTGKGKTAKGNYLVFKEKVVDHLQMHFPEAQITKPVYNKGAIYITNLKKTITKEDKLLQTFTMLEKKSNTFLALKECSNFMSWDEMKTIAQLAKFNIQTHSYYIYLAGEYGDLDEAKRVFESQFELDKTYLPLQNAYLDVLVSQGRLDEAVRIFHKMHLNHKRTQLSQFEVLHLQGHSYGAIIAVLKLHCARFNGIAPPFMCYIDIGCPTQHDYVAFQDEVIKHLWIHFPQTILDRNLQHKYLFISNLKS